MLKIEFSPTFNRIKEFADEYNKDFLQGRESNYTGTNHIVKKKLDPDVPKRKIKDVGKMLRRSHIELMRQLAICLAQQIALEQRLRGPLSYSIERDDLDWLKTNNVALATMLNCSDKTIYRQLCRLESAGFIEQRTFFGSNADFKLKLKTSILMLYKNGNPIFIPSKIHSNSVEKSRKKEVNDTSITRQNHVKITSINPQLTVKKTSIARQNPHIQDDSNLTHISDIQNEDRTELDHKFKTETYKRNYNKLSCGNVDISTISDCLKTFKGNMSSQENGSDFPSKSTENSGPSKQLNISSQSKKTPLVAAAPPEAAKCSKDVEKYGQLLMNLMFATIFSKMHYHAPSQIEACRTFIFKELGELEGRQLKSHFQEIQIRIQLAWDWVKRDPENRYIPNSPKKYLDRENINGFSRTKIWFEMIKDNKRKVTDANERALELHARWKALNEALEIYLVDQNNTNYFRGRRKAEEQHPEVLRAYEEMVKFNNKKFVA